MPKINFQEEQVFEAFIHKMIVDKGLAETDRQQNGKIQRELSMQLDEAIQKAVINALSDEQLQKLSGMLDNDIGDAELESFFDNSGIDYRETVGRAMREFREDYLGINTTTNEPNNLNNTGQMPNGMPMQGTVSEVPGASNVEGVAQPTYGGNEGEI